MTRNSEPAHESSFEHFWKKLFIGSGENLRKSRVREYIIHRVNHGAHLKEVLGEDYVRRNCTEKEVNEIIRDPRLIHETRLNLERLFESGELHPNPTRRRR